MRTGMSREKRTICGVAETWSRSPTGKDDVHVKDSSISCKRTCRIMPESSSEACQQAILSVQKSLPKYAQKSSEACQQVFQSVQKSIPKHARQSSKVCQKALRSVQNVLPKYAKKSSEACERVCGRVLRSMKESLPKHIKISSEVCTKVFRIKNTTPGLSTPKYWNEPVTLGAIDSFCCIIQSKNDQCTRPLILTGPIF